MFHASRSVRARQVFSAGSALLIVGYEPLRQGAAGIFGAGFQSFGLADQPCPCRELQPFNQDAIYCCCLRLDAPYSQGVEFWRGRCCRAGRRAAGVVAPGAAIRHRRPARAASRARDPYSQNGKNMAAWRQSDNSRVKNTSLEPRAMKRRATMGCKSGKVLAQARFADEKACTVAVLDGPGVQRVVDALDALGDECLIDATHVCL